MLLFGILVQIWLLILINYTGKFRIEPIFLQAPEYLLLPEQVFHILL
jgi:hypothetical protein